MADSRKYRELIKHAGVYGVGTVLSRMTSLLLLPVYTRYLAPEDYGVIAILDTMAAILATLMTAGVLQAVTRHHFRTKGDRDRRALWWTGLFMIGLTATTLALPALAFSRSLADVLLGTEVVSGGFFVCVIIGTVWLISIDAILVTLLRVQKMSGTFVGFSLARLILNAVLNISLLVYGMGIAGVLVGNLITAGASTCFLLIVFAKIVGRVRLEARWAGALFRYGTPLVLTGALGFVMHQSDRYLLRLFLPLEEVGIYSLAYSLAYGVSMLLLQPFGAIWNVTKFEHAEDRSATTFYAGVFSWFMLVVILALLGLSLFAEPLIAVVATPAYQDAALLVPFIALGYVFFAANTFFTIPATTCNQTRLLLPASVVAAIVNILANLALIPVMGVVGAAIATVATFVVLAGTNGIIGYRILHIPFPLRQVSLAAVLGVAICGFRVLIAEGASPLTLSHIGGLAVWMLIGTVLVFLALRSHLVRPAAALATVEEP